MRHPLDWIPATSRKLFFFPFLFLTLSLFAIFRILDQPLRTPAAPNGIVSYELAGTTEKVFQILVSWEPVRDGNGSAIPTRKLYAAFGLGIDYLFMPIYAIALALSTLLAAGKYTGWVKSLGALAGWGALCTAGFDAVENFALWKILLGEINSPYPKIAFYCASIKFSLLVVGLLYAIVGWLWPKRNVK